jgi:heptosyltransferase-2
LKILVIRFSSIGDIVLTSPVIRCLKNQIADAEIHFLTKEPYAEIVENNPHITKVFTIKAYTDEVIALLKAEQYDYIIDLHDNIRSRQVCSELKATIFRYKKQRLQRFLLIKFKIDTLNNHVVDRYFSAVKPIHVINDGKGLDFFIPEHDHLGADKLPFTHVAGYCVIAIGTKHFTKTIPLYKLEELCRQINIPIILLGDMHDAYNGTQLEKIDNFKIYNACGKFSITQSASIIQRAKFIITGDTGMMHIAAALNKRIISIWGGTDKRLGFYPYQNSSVNSVIIENTAIKCRPCSKHGLSACPKDHFNCMNQLDMQKVITVIGQ